MRNVPPLRNQLLNVSESVEKQEPGRNPTREDLENLAKTLGTIWGHSIPMTAEHARIVAFLFRKALTSTCSIEPVGFLSEVYGDLELSLRRLRYICDLIERGLVSLEERHSWRRRRPAKAYGQTVNPSDLIETEIKLSDEVVSYLLNGAKRRIRRTVRPFKSNQEFLEAWLEYIASVCDAVRYANRHFGRLDQDDETKELLDQLEKRSRASRRRFPLQRLSKKLSLSHDERMIVAYALLRHLDGEIPDSGEITDLLGTSRLATLNRRSPLDPKGKLMRHGVILPVGRNRGTGDSGTFMIAPQTARYLLGSSHQTGTNTLRSFLDGQDILTHVKPKIALSDLILPAGTMTVVNRAVESVRQRNHQKLTDWGIIRTDHQPSPRGESCGERLLILLHGDPGTGKTALAHALADTLKRPLLTSDISKILDKWVGESQKRLSSLFDRYDLIATRLHVNPVLLLNEADQFLGHRLAAERGAERMYNQLTNILLERLEEFSGILIATTNLIENVDTAFSRRFDIKIELPRPSEGLRRRIWNSLLPKKLPLGADVDPEALASRYAFTGGQIAVIIRNAANAAASRRGGKQIVTQDDLVRYAELERSGAFETDSQKPIGFAVNGH